MSRRKRPRTKPTPAPRPTAPSPRSRETTAAAALSPTTAATEAPTPGVAATSTNSPSTPLLRLEHLTLGYRTQEGPVTIVDDASLSLFPGDTLALIGESGCGKSTLTNAILGLGGLNRFVGEDSRILWKGRDMLRASDAQLRAFRWQEASMIFQAAQNALNPTIPLREQFLDSVWDHDASRGPAADEARVRELLDLVRLDADRILDAFPHQLSGGMRQRVIIAMAMVLDPEFLILDEPTTALDTITQFYVFDILAGIQRDTGTAMMLVTHDLASAARLCSRVGVMYAGHLVELGPAQSVFHDARHPYAAALIRACPVIDGDVSVHEAIAGAMPDLMHRPEGCPFHPRCSHVLERCRHERPPFEAIAPDHWRACWKEDFHGAH